MKKFNEFIKESRFSIFGGEIVYAGKSKYPVGTKIKFKDDGKYYTGTLTQPFGFCSGDVGVFIDQDGLYRDNKCCLYNKEYIVIDDEEVEEFIKNHKFKTDVNKFNL